MDRRTLLGAAGSLIAAGGLGYGWVRESGEEGRVFWRQMAVDAGGEPGSLIVMTAFEATDGGVEYHVDPEYRAAFEEPGQVPASLHETLRDRYGEGEPYYLVRYTGADCNGIPGDEGGDAIEVSRTEFNRLTVGTCVKR